MMNYLAFGCKMEYKFAVKRLEELAYAQPGTQQAQERKELISLLVQFEKHLKKVKQGAGSNL